jgi:hypothetical protein
MGIRRRQYTFRAKIDVALINFRSWSPTTLPGPGASADTNKLAVNQQHLKQAWDVSRVESREDWDEWFKKFSTELLRESTSHALRACVSLVEAHPPLGLELFNAAFISCWMELYDQYQVPMHFTCTLRLLISVSRMILSHRSRGLLPLADMLFLPKISLTLWNSWSMKSVPFLSTRASWGELPNKPPFMPKLCITRSSSTCASVA